MPDARAASRRAGSGRGLATLRGGQPGPDRHAPAATPAALRPPWPPASRRARCST